MKLEPVITRLPPEVIDSTVLVAIMELHGRIMGDVFNPVADLKLVHLLAERAGLGEHAAGTMMNLLSIEGNASTIAAEISFYVQHELDYLLGSEGGFNC